MADIHESVLDSARICAEADSIQQELLIWFAARPASFTSGLLHTRRHFQICLAMNQYRCARITVDQILSMWHVPNHLHEANKEISELISDTVHSINFLVSFRGDYVAQLSILSLMLPWPLFVLATSPASPNETQKWAEAFLHTIGERTGIGQISVILGLLQQRGLSSTPSSFYAESLFAGTQRHFSRTGRP
jgi:hypothetical protein